MSETQADSETARRSSKSAPIHVRHPILWAWTKQANRWGAAIALAVAIVGVLLVGPTAALVILTPITLVVLAGIIIASLIVAPKGRSRG